MRLVFLLLLLANVALLAYIRLAPESGREPQILNQQIHPERIRIVSPAELARPGAQSTLGDSRAACLEWGPFADNQLARAQAALEALPLHGKVATRDLQTTASYWVYIPPLPGRREADRKLSELKALGVSDYFLVQDGGKWHNAISLGVFKTEEAAKSRLAALQKKGVRSALAGEYSQKATVALVVRDADPSLATRLAALQQDFPGSELKATACN